MRHSWPGPRTRPRLTECPAIAGHSCFWADSRLLLQAALKYAGHKTTNDTRVVPSERIYPRCSHLGNRQWRRGHENKTRFVFERSDDGTFAPPSHYPALAAASAATHDIATLKGFWLGRDILWRRRLGLYPDRRAQEAEVEERRRDRHLMLDALVREGLIAPAQIGELLPEDKEPVYTAELGDAILAYLARSRARLMLVQLEDVLSEVDQANLPGTTDAHPNWRRRITQSLEEIDRSAVLRRIAALIETERRCSATG